MIAISGSVAASVSAPLMPELDSARLAALIMSGSATLALISAVWTSRAITFMHRGTWPSASGAHLVPFQTSQRFHGTTYRSSSPCLSTRRRAKPSSVSGSGLRLPLIVTTGASALLPSVSWSAGCGPMPGGSLAGLAVSARLVEIGQAGRDVRHIAPIRVSERSTSACSRGPYLATAGS